MPSLKSPITQGDQIKLGKQALTRKEITLSEYSIHFFN